MNTTMMFVCFRSFHWLLLVKENKANRGITFTTILREALKPHGFDKNILPLFRFSSCNISTTTYNIGLLPISFFEQSLSRHLHTKVMIHSYYDDNNAMGWIASAQHCMTLLINYDSLYPVTHLIRENRYTNFAIRVILLILSVNKLRISD